MDLQAGKGVNGKATVVQPVAPTAGKGAVS